MLSVHQLPLAERGLWNFRGSELTWRHDGGLAATFDPFPGYPHDLATVQATAEAVTLACPPPWPVQLYLADREEVGRSNGFSHARDRGHYETGDDGVNRWVQQPPAGLILLSGKRIPPHPAMSRYLVGHEYGHHVEYFLLRARGHKGLYGDDVVAEYAQVRGLPDGAVHHGSGGRWHDAAAEIFACDFRILMCGIELEFWPHPGVPYPADVAGLDQWWDAALADIAALREDPGRVTADA